MKQSSIVSPVTILSSDDSMGLQSGHDVPVELFGNEKSRITFLPAAIKHDVWLQQISRSKKRIKRPIEFRLDGAPVCQIFPEVDDILELYSSVLLEKRVLVISSSLRY